MIESSPKRAIPRGIPRLPVFPTIVPTKTIDCSFLSSKSFKTIGVIIKRSTIEKIIKRAGALIVEKFSSLFAIPQNVKIGWRVYKEINTKVFSSTLFFPNFFAPKPSRIKR